MLFDFSKCNQCQKINIEQKIVMHYIFPTSVCDIINDFSKCKCCKKCVELKQSTNTFLNQKHLSSLKTIQLQIKYFKLKHQHPSDWWKNIVQGIKTIDQLSDKNYLKKDANGRMIWKATISYVSDNIKSVMDIIDRMIVKENVRGDILFISLTPFVFENQMYNIKTVLKPFFLEYWIDRIGEYIEFFNIDNFCTYLDEIFEWCI